MAVQTTEFTVTAGSATELSGTPAIGSRGWISMCNISSQEMFWGSTSNAASLIASGFLLPSGETQDYDETLAKVAGEQIFITISWGTGKVRVLEAT